MKLLLLIPLLLIGCAVMDGDRAARIERIRELKAKVLPVVVGALMTEGMTPMAAKEVAKQVLIEILLEEVDDSTEDEVIDN